MHVALLGDGEDTNRFPWPRLHIPSMPPKSKLYPLAAMLERNYLFVFLLIVKYSFFDVFFCLSYSLPTRNEQHSDVMVEKPDPENKYDGHDRRFF